MMNTPNGILVRLVALVNGINPDIGTLNKYKGDVSSDYFTEIFKARFLCYVNEAWFKKVNAELKDAYLGGRTPTDLQNEVSTYQQMHYNKYTHIMANQLLNEFYT